MAKNLYPDAKDVAYYRDSRYQTRDQRFISRREQNLIVGVLASLEAPSGKVLDAPCGYGRFTKHLIARGWTPTVSDYAPAMVEYCQTTAKKEYGAELPGAQGDLFGELPFAPNSFDGALCVRMLHNTLDSDRRILVFKALARVTRDWIVVTYYGDPLIHQIQFAVRKKVATNPRETMAFVSRTQLAREVAAAGLRVERDLAVLPGFHAQRIAVLRKNR